ncbi:hypothetical protein ACSVH5_03920 [Flavobacterium sp. RSSA_27]|uniref:hypothetical protein n=1 Tax=Flavobacterium sp. RSSA_27 TaxID=3447667 RepID=UPI003F3A1E3A
MKKFLFILLITSISYAQRTNERFFSFSLAFDVENLIVGSKPTNFESAFNYFIQASRVSRNFEINLGYERFNRINFSKNTIGFGYHIPFSFDIGNKEINSRIILSTQPTLINRWSTWGGGLSENYRKSYFSVGVSFAYRLDISKSFALEYMFNALPREDIYHVYGNSGWKGRASINGIPVVGSNFFKMVYKLHY